MNISVVYLFLFISNCVCILYIYVLYDERYCLYIYLPHIYSYSYRYCITREFVIPGIEERKKILIQYVSQLKYTENRECQ